MNVAGQETVAAVPERYGFGRCQLDLTRRELRLDGQPVRLQPRIFDLLVHFVMRPGEALSKDTLIAAVWPSTAVTDSVLTTAIGKVRKAIGDDDETQPLLRTLHGVGYRFDASVQAMAQGHPQTPGGAADELPGDGRRRLPLPGLSTWSEPPPLRAAQTEFWRHQAQRARRLLLAGQSRSALEILERVHAQQPPDVAGIALRVRALRHRLRLDEARGLLSAVLARPAGVLAPEERAALLLEQAWLHDQHRDHAQAVSAVEEALRALSARPPDALWHETLAAQALLLWRAGQAAQGQQVARRVLALTEGGPPSAARVSALLLTSRQAAIDEAFDDALEIAREACLLARSGDLADAEGDALVWISYCAGMIGHADVSECFARLAMQACGRDGDLARVAEAQRQLIIALALQGRRNEAVQVWESLTADAEIMASAVAVLNLDITRFYVFWIQGRTDEALELLTRLLTEPASSVVKANVRRVHAMCHLSLGRAGPARAILADPLLADTPELLPALEAALALLEGRRGQAKQALDDLYRAPRASSLVVNAILSLAWLSLEDGDAERLAQLMPLVRSLSPSGPAVPLLLYRHAVQVAREGFDPVRWDALVRACPGLVNRHAWLLDEATVRAMLDGGRGPTMSELYGGAWF